MLAATSSPGPEETEIAPSRLSERTLDPEFTEIGPSRLSEHQPVEQEIVEEEELENELESLPEDEDLELKVDESRAFVDSI